MALVSTIIPMFNSAETLRETVDSALSQSVRDIEVLLIDDGSTDRTLDVAGEIARNDARVRVLRQANRGAAAARNAGLDAARGVYVHFLDSDDLLVAGAYERLINAERGVASAGAGGASVGVAGGGSGAAVGGYDCFTEREGTLLLHESPTGCGELGLREVIVRNVLTTISQILRRDAIGALRFDPGLECYEDQDLWVRLAERGVRWRAAAGLVARYRMRRGSLSKSLATLGCAQRVYVDAQARTGAMTGAEFEQRLFELALGYSTRAALVLPGAEVERALDLYGGARGRGAIGAKRAAEMGHSQTIFGLGVWPGLEAVDGRGETVGAKLTAWWRGCAVRGWMKPGDVEAALEHFARLCVHPRRIARAMFEGVKAGDDVTLVGYGRNARWLAEEGVARGARVRARDERFASGDAAAVGVELLSGVVAEAIDAPASEGGVVMITPIDDGGLVERYPGARRWCEARERLVREGALKAAVTG